MAKIKHTEHTEKLEEKKPIRKKPETVRVVSIGNFTIILSHSYVCRLDQKCRCATKIRNGKYLRIPMSIHLIEGIPVDVPAVKIYEKNGDLKKLIDSRKVKIVEK